MFLQNQNKNVKQFIVISLEFSFFKLVFCIITWNLSYDCKRKPLFFTPYDTCVFNVNKYSNRKKWDRRDKK